MSDGESTPVTTGGGALAARARAGAPHAVVIGAGFGGLAAAIRLGARGYRVTVLERRDAPGGRAYVYRQDGYTFDAGPTIVTAPFLFEELWRLCGRRLADDVELRALDPFYRIRFQDGDHFDTRADPAAMREEVGRISPRDVSGYERFMAMSEAIYRVGFERLGHVPFESWRDMLRLVPELVRLQSYRTIYQLVAAHVRDPKLRFALSFHPLFVGGNPFTTTSVYGLIAFLERTFGVHCAIGGTGQLVSGMVDLLRGQGGVLRCGAEVEQILIESGTARGVRLRGGEELRADIVVSNADSAWTYSRLVPAGARRRWTDRRLARSRYSMSVFVWYFGLRRRYPDVPHHTILVGPRYREHVQDIFERRVLAEDFSLYLHRPTATDPSVAPPGGDTYYVLSPVPHLESGVDWATRAEGYRRVIARELDRTLLPGFEAEIATSRIVTPVDFRDELLSVHGAAFGLQPVLLQSAWFRPHNRSEDVRHLYLVGAGTHPGAGLPGVLSSARVLDAVVPDARAFA
ncbi:MAG: phytoene desaturase [Proteobacteria bacterium]|nr:phytoene desaturase [Pseudomonadota bacterium]